MQAVERYSNAKIRFQSFFMLMIVQACFVFRRATLTP